MIFNKKKLGLIVSENLSFVYEFICHKYSYTGTFDDFLIEYRDFLKILTSKKNNNVKE